MDHAPDQPRNAREWQIIEKLLLRAYSEQRSARRWGIFFKLLTFLYLGFLVLALFWSWPGSSGTSKGPHTALVEVAGMIAADEVASADAVVASLRQAFAAEQARGVILRINSPGGSPVQAGYIYDEINRLKALHPDKRTYAVIADIGASGGYYIAAAADEIYADKASLVGSIGVTSAGFGFVETLDKLGVERRNYTSGSHKSFLDPFLPEDPEEVELWESVLATTHQQFIDQVQKGRGERLVGPADLLFSGMIWSGEQAVEVGLVDGLASSSTVAREIIGAEEIVDYTWQPDRIEQLVSQLGVTLARELGTRLQGGLLELR